MNTKTFQLLLFSLSILFFTNCKDQTVTTISGTIDYLGDSELYIEMPPLHYKYSPKERSALTVNQGKFNAEINIKEPEIIWLVLQDFVYPFYAEPGIELSIEIIRSDFPYEVEIKGYDKDYNLAYQEFLKETENLDTAIKAEMDKFKVGQRNTALAYSEIKLESAEKHFKGTPLEPLYQKIVGEDLVLRLRAVEYSNRFISNYDVDSERQKVVNKALQKEFFTLSSLEAQRAGIRDFSHYYSRTFGIYDSVMNAYGTSLAEYDIKQVAYEELNEKRMQVINVIEDRDAKAYAEMFIVAERIGEQPISISEPTYFNFLKEYEEYTEYTDFLTYFYNEIKSVSPGEPAIPFQLADRSGEIHTLDEYKGKFVLLDFWAGWCQPCLVEFPHMRELYSDYSRNELEILGISTEVDSLVWIQDITRFENPWPQLYGGDGMDQKTFKAYKGGGIPFYILVDPDGNIARYNDIRPSFNFTEVLDSLITQYNQ
ncbi:MAG: TlpA family protein disulfide reductase [Balneolaceae bacterium]|nr:TlpA family protein disulfide reductase [Balneolaceae bacterium]MBO6546763.1 TlpA family protein disulfide reductase [Balneolaceae bacterium]MBO6649123.1 TlpA family protein disulfide reductase [Balneolaceae bacterium]